LGFTDVRVVQDRQDWPGMPVLAVFDLQSAIIASREGNAVQGHWSTAPSFIAAARLAFQQFTLAHD
jgi:hypothetical protein